MSTSRLVIASAALAVIASPGLLASPASAATGVWTNCTHLNKSYPHGVGRVHAHDHASGTPVTNFKHSDKLYKTAIRHNKRLDADKDGIACEKK